MVTAEYIKDVLTLGLTELQAKYKQKSDPTKPTIKDKRSHQILVRKYGKQVKTMEAPNPDSHDRLNKISELLSNAGIQPDEIGDIQSVRIGTYQMLSKNDDGEAEIHDLEVRNIQYKPKREVAELWQPATPARITPSRRKPVVRDHKIIFGFTDAQIDFRRKPDGTLVPIHDERVIRVAHMLCREYQPEEVINTGDTLDFAGISRFPTDSNDFQATLGPSFQRVHDMYAQFRSDLPNAKITEVDSNHNTRLKKHFMKNAPEFYGIRRPGADADEYPMLTYPYFANLGKLGINWVSGYGAAEYIYGAEYGKPPIIFKHGMTSVAGGSTASKESRANPENHVVRGHSHRTETAYRTKRDGTYLASIVMGASCKITGEVPSYYSAVDDQGEVVKYQENWQQSLLLIRDYEGEYQFDHIMVRDGIANYNGKTYDGNES